MRADHVFIAVATPLGAALLYFLLAGQVSGGEALAGAPALVITCFYARALARTGSVELALARRAVVSLLLACLAVVPDLWRTGRGLLHAVRRRPEDMQGVIKHVPFRYGGPEPADRGRRAAVGVAMSLAPNAFVIGMDHDRDELIVHRLVPSPAGGDREWPL